MWGKLTVSAGWTPRTREIAELKRLVAEQAATIKELLQKIEQLQRRLSQSKKNSSDSSKPPSSDIVKPKRPDAKGKGRRGKRKQGGQPGHAKHERAKFPPEMLDNTWEYHLSECPVCGEALLPADEAPRAIQQVEIVAKPIRIDEHRGLAYWCESCQKVHYAPLLPEVQKGGLFGPELTAVVAYMKGICHAAYEELLSILSGEGVVNVDETGHKEKGRRLWAWCFRAELYTLFRIDESRGSQVILDTLGEEFDGVLGCDDFGAYRKYLDTFDVRAQFCSGRRCCERIWTALATCARTGRDVLDFLHQSLLAHLRAEPPPSLPEPACR